MIRRLFFLVSLLLLAGAITVAHAAEAPGQSARRPLPPKLIGGTEAKAGDWPWMAALVYASEPESFDGQFCGGALIDESWILTAAHCVYNPAQKKWKAPGEVDVVLGVHDLHRDSGDRIEVKRIIGHPDYDPVSMDGDIALLELDSPSTAPAIELFTGNSGQLIGSMSTVTGWGDTDSGDGTTHPSALQQVSLPVVANSICNDAYMGSGDKITNNMICAGYASGGKDSCQGDSGGPLMVEQDGRWLHIGIVSWGEGCALADYYGVNTRTSQYINFIQQHIPPQARISLAPSSVTFSETSPGSSKQQEIIVTNTGNLELSIVSIAHNDPLEKPFSITTDNCSGQIIAPSDQCTITIQVNLFQSGSFNDTFDISSNVPYNNPVTVSVSSQGSFPWMSLIPFLTTGERHAKTPDTPSTVP